MRLAILDDYLGIARDMADWDRVASACDIEVFREHLDLDQAAEALASFDIICLMRERMAMPAALIERLPNLSLIVSTGGSNTSLDIDAATRHGVLVCFTKGAPDWPHGAAELAWALVLDLAKRIEPNARAIRSGGWQAQTGVGLHGKTLGLIGLGNIGRVVAGYGRAFGMNVLAWSQNLTDETAAQAGAERVEKAHLLAESDVISVHYALSDRSRGLIGAKDFAQMKPTVLFVNTARAQIVDEAALIDAIQSKRIAGAALDVFSVEPLPARDPLRTLENVLPTPHLGYAAEHTMRAFYEHTVATVEAYLAGAPTLVKNPSVLERR